ncbi:hypothetical protein B5F34_08665 [Mediterranea sp. An20]|jgi:uncharacterized membrane protein|nr:hypothetical protein B5F34_08665 [Mediterranea sp. An20]
MIMKQHFFTFLCAFLVCFVVTWLLEAFLWNKERMDAVVVSLIVGAVVAIAVTIQRAWVSRRVS